MTQTATQLSPGFADPVFDSQRAFRTVLDAMANPGRIYHLPIAPPAPAPLAPAAAALALALLDFETPLWLQVPVAGTVDYLRFHCGCPLADAPARAAFALVTDATDMPALSVFNPGEPEYPDRSTTLIIQVDYLREGAGVALSGPGIKGRRVLDTGFLPLSFWQQVAINHKLFPCGVDLILCCGTHIAALPRTTIPEA